MFHIWWYQVRDYLGKPVGTLLTSQRVATSLLSVLEGPLMSANKNVVTILYHIISLLYLVMWIRALVLEVRNPQSMGPRKVSQKEAIFNTGINS